MTDTLKEDILKLLSVNDMMNEITNRLDFNLNIVEDLC